VPDSPGREILLKAAHLAFKAHVFTSIENEAHKALREVADEAAIKVFGRKREKVTFNAAPFGPKSVLGGSNPGIKTGCKLAVVERTQENTIASTVIFPP
jgi:uncharacterized protein